MDCIFCKIINGEIPAEVVARDDFTITVLDVHPRALGHSMVLPRKHADSILELEDNQLQPVLGAVKGATEMLKKAFSPDGFTIGINHGRVAGQEIDHLHVHIIPRWRSDGGMSVQGVVSNPPKDSLKEVANTIHLANEKSEK